MTNQLVIATHILLLELAFFHPVAGLLYERYAEVEDPFFLRILMAVCCLGISLLILLVKKIRRLHWQISRAVFLVFGLHLVYLTWLNNLEPVYFATLPVVLVSAPIFFTRFKQLLPVLLVFVVLLLAIGYDRQHSEHLIFFFLLTGLSLPISFFNLFLFQRIIKKLQFSDYVLNNIDALVLAANKDGEVIFASKNINRILGFSRQEVLGKGWWNLRLRREVNSEELQRFANQMETYADNPEGYDGKAPHKSGEDRWFQWKIVRLGKDINVGVGQDISKRKAMESELQKLSLIARETDNLVLLLTPDHRVEWVNAGFTKITQLIPANSEHKPVTEVFRGSAEMVSLLHTTLTEVLNSKSAQYAEFQFERPDGSAYWTNINFTPILLEDKVTQVICIGRDSTQTKLAEEQIKLYHDRLEALHKLDHQLFSAETLEELVINLAGNIKEIQVAFNRVSVAIYEFEEGYVKVLSCNPSFVEAELEVNDFPISDFKRSIDILKSAEYVLNDLSELSVDELTATQQFLRDKKGVKTYISLPIRYQGELVGSLNFGGESLDLFADDIIDYLLQLVSDVALAVYQFQLKEAVRMKNLRLEERNKDIEDSIHYAQRIQHAVFPANSDLEEFFEDSFVLFQPKDKLSGDFYWLEETEHAIWLAVADCTGHGVPGAFVSLVGTNILNQAVHEKKLDSPDEILAYLNSKIIRTFYNSNGSNVNDALDIGICRIDKHHSRVSFSGVLHDLYLVRNGELLTYKASRFPIGIKPERVYMDFEVHEIELQENDSFYLLTDGFVDQFGGESNKKFGRRNLKKIVCEISSYPMSEQQRILQNAFALWQRDQEQTDDVLCIGFRARQRN
jgi:PAS domain S-box-containing protein